MGTIIKLILPKVLKLVIDALSPTLGPLQKYVYEENELDIKVLKMQAQMNLLQEILLETQSDVEALKLKKRKPRKRKNNA